MKLVTKTQPRASDDTRAEIADRLVTVDADELQNSVTVKKFEKKEFGVRMCLSITAQAVN